MRRVNPDLARVHSMGLASRARIFALHAHGQQCRPNASREPMVVHLSEVASYVRDEAGDEAAVACAWLHDVVEDTQVAVGEIRDRFGQRLSEFVDLLTDPPGWAAAELTGRKVRQAQRVAGAPDLVKLVKLADQVSNVRSVLFDPPTDWSQEKSNAYVRGALLVGRACADVSPRLDALLQHYVTLALQPGGESGIKARRASTDPGH